MLADLLQDHERSGWWKALWIPFLIFIPFISALVYVIVHGSGMAERRAERRTGIQPGRAAYEREAEPRSPGEELAQLQGLRERGALTDVEFETAKARFLA